MKEKVKLQPVSLSKAMHEKVRHAAFKRRISMKEVVEEALKNHYGYGWNDDKRKTEGGKDDSPAGNKSPSPG